MKKMFLILTLMLSFMVSSVVSAKMYIDEKAEEIMVFGEPIMPITTDSANQYMKTGGLWLYEDRIHYCGIMLFDSTSPTALVKDDRVIWKCINSKFE